MAHENTTTYLNDHYAGSVFAVALTGDLIESTLAVELKTFLEELRTEIMDDQAVLREIMARLGVAEDRFKNTTAWLSEKAGRIKLHPTRGEDVSLLLSLESLLLGISGKKALWRALDANGSDPNLEGIDLGRLEARANAQIEAVEAHRLEAARAVLHIAAQAA